ncbi:MAG: hypothetical protein RL660_2929, partial [Bacteroidota bacterium]
MKKHFYIFICFFLGLAAKGSAQISATYAAINVTCFGDSNGAITVTPYSGTPPYQYKLENGAWQSSNVFSALWADTFIVYIQDSLGAMDSNQFVAVTQPPVLTADIFVYGSVCGLQQPLAQVSSIGGTPPYGSSFSPPTMLDGNGNYILTNFGQAYIYSVIDALGCTATDSVTLPTPPNIQVSFTPIDTNLCGLTAAVTGYQMSASGGTAYTYSLPPMTPNGVTIDSNNQIFAFSGTYTVVVTDISGCYITASVTFGPVTPLVNWVDINSTGFNPCDSVPSFQLAANFWPPNAAHTIKWYFNGSNTPFSTDDTTAVLNAHGSYILELTDSNGCVYTAVEDFRSDTLSIYSSADTVCQGEIFKLYADKGNSSNYLYWSPLGTTGDTIYHAINANTTYTVATLDPNFCIDAVNKTIFTKDTNFTTSLNFILTPPSCSYDTDGSIIVQSTPSNPNLTYLWQDGTTADSLSNLTQGTYHVLLSEANACMYKEFDLISTNVNCGTISGKVVYDANADCIAQGSEASISNVHVQISPLNATAVTNAAGEYVISGIPLGTYTLSQSNLPSGIFSACSNLHTISLSSFAPSAIVDFADSLDFGIDYIISSSGLPCFNPLIP